MNEENLCQRCGREMEADAAEGMCPSCLMEANLATGAETFGTVGGGRREPLPVADLAGHFPELEILELIGAGGMGAVYKARQPKLNRLVALKILHRDERDPRFVERFTREAQTLALLNHPNIVAVYEFGERDGLFFLVMELVDGVTLRDLLSGGRPGIAELHSARGKPSATRRSQLQPEQALAIVPPICEALQYAHEKGVIHRDIKPENILIDKDGRVKVADFGVARLAGLESKENLTGEGQVIGTAHYMAPEQVERPAEVDHRADIYALGVVFYEMLTGELPLGRFLQPSKKVQIDVRLDEIVLRALENQPALRYQTAGEMKTRVETMGAMSSAGRAEGLRESDAPSRSKAWAEHHAGMPKVLWIALVMLGVSAVANAILVPWSGAIGLFDTGFKALLILGLWYRFRTGYLLTLLAALIAVVASFNVSAPYGFLIAAVHIAVVFPLLKSTHWFFPGVAGRFQFPPWLTRSPGMKAWICLLLAAGAFALMWVALSGNVVDWPTVYFWMSLGALLTLLGLFFVWLAGKRAMRMFGGIVGVGAVVGLATMFLLERPRMIDTRGEYHTEDGRYSAFFSTWRAMRMFGNDEIFYRFRLVEKTADGGQGRLIKEWDVPYRPLPRPPRPQQGSMDATEYMAKVHEWDEATSRPFSDLLFERNGEIDWSNDSRRVTFRVGEREISAFDIESGDITFGGFLPEREVVLKGSPKLEKCFFDLDTGEVMSAPADWVAELRARGRLYDGATPPSVLREWMRPSGADLFKSVTIETYVDAGAGPEPSREDDWSLLHVGGVVSYMSPEDFSFDLVSAEQIKKFLHGRERMMSESPGKWEDAVYPLQPAHISAFKTREGRIGVMEVQKEGRDRMRVRYKLLPDATVYAEPPFVANYGRGTVELVALAPHPLTDGRAWLANGAPSKQSFPELKEGKSWAEGKVMKEIAFRVRSENDTASSPVFEYIPERDVLGQGSSYFPKEPGTDGRYFVQIVACSPGTKQANLRVGIGDGPWEEVISLPFGADNLYGGTQQSGEQGTWEAGFQGIASEAGEVALSLRYSNQDKWETRMVALKKDGIVAPLKGGRSDHSAGLIQTMVSLSPEEVAEIVQIQLQRRKYTWVEFRNVSLEAEHRTNVKVSDVGGGEQTRADSGASPEQEAFTFSHRPQLGQALLDASRDFADEHQWKVMREGGVTTDETETVTIEATDLADKRVTFEVAAQAEGETAHFTVDAEPGSEFSPHRIGTAIARRVGHAAGWATEGDEAAAPSQARDQETFGPETERVLQLFGFPGRITRGLDLDRNRFVDIPEGHHRAIEISDLGVDLMTIGDGEEDWVLLTTARLASLDEEVWLVNDSNTVHTAFWEHPRRLDLEMKPDEFGWDGYVIDSQTFPITLAFETARGSRGLLQILDETSDPPGLRVRYKYAQKGSE